LVRSSLLEAALELELGQLQAGASRAGRRVSDDESRLGRVRFVAPALLVVLLVAWVILFVTGDYIAGILVVGIGSLILPGWRRFATRSDPPS
jgi:hypothetical protein